MIEIIKELLTPVYLGFQTVVFSYILYQLLMIYKVKREELKEIKDLKKLVNNTK